MKGLSLTPLSLSLSRWEACASPASRVDLSRSLSSSRSRSRSAFSRTFTWVRHGFSDCCLKPNHEVVSRQMPNTGSSCFGSFFHQELDTPDCFCTFHRWATAFSSLKEQDFARFQATDCDSKTEFKCPNARVLPHHKLWCSPYSWSHPPYWFSE